MTRDHDPHLADQMQIGALQQAGNRDADEPIRYGWLVVVAALCLPLLVVGIWRLVGFLIKSGASL